MTKTTAPYFDAFSELFDRFTRIWDGISADFDDWIASALPVRVRTAVDLGCGAGRHSVLLAGRADRVLAVDVAGRMLAVARDQRARPNVDYQRRGQSDGTDGRLAGGVPGDDLRRDRRGRAVNQGNRL